jgi:hypothetical protein
MDAFELSVLVSRVFDTWEAWREEAVVLKAAVGSKQEAILIKTAVKATKTLPRLKSSNDMLDMTMDEGFGLELDQRLKVIGLAIEELLQESVMDMDEINVKVEGEEDSVIQGDRLSTPMILECINLLQKAFVELNDRAIGGLKEFQVGFGVRLAGLEAIIGSFSSVETKVKQAGGSISVLLEDLEDQVGQLRSVEHVRYLIGKVFQSAEMTSQNDSVKEAFRAVMHRLMGVERAIQDVQ